MHSEYSLDIKKSRLSANISMHSLLIDLHTFLMVLVGRIYIKIKTAHL